MYATEFNQLYGVLSCPGGGACKPLYQIDDTAGICLTPSDDCESPIKWTGKFGQEESVGRFPYASSATEAFLLEYANGMPKDKVGWGRVAVSANDACSKLRSMMHLHEIYFDRTERQQYLAQIDGSNLIREILDQINRKARRVNPIDGKCPRADAGSQFVGLVGHDTNLAGVGSLLQVGWYFFDKSRKLPPDTLYLPPNDALPAGALVFELRKRSEGYFVRLVYMAQSLEQMRSSPSDNEPYRLSVSCHDESGKYLNPCELSLDTFNNVVTTAIGQNNPFLSRCDTSMQQICDGDK